MSPKKVRVIASNDKVLSRFLMVFTWDARREGYLLCTLWSVLRPLWRRDQMKNLHFLGRLFFYKYLTQMLGDCCWRLYNLSLSDLTVKVQFWARFQSIWSGPEVGEGRFHEAETSVHIASNSLSRSCLLKQGSQLRLIFLLPSLFNNEVLQLLLLVSFSQLQSKRRVNIENAIKLLH